MKNKTIKGLLAMSVALVFALTSTVMIPTVSGAASKTVTVKTQKQLDAALKEKQVTSIVIKTSKNVTLKIKDGDYGKINLVVDTPKATINNYGDFKKISITDGKKFVERGAENNIVVKDTNSLKLVTGKQSEDTKITMSGKGGKLGIENNGEVDRINMKSKATVTLSGEAKEAPTITCQADGAKIVAAMDANVVLNKSADLTVKSGAEVESLNVNANADIKVATDSEVEKLTVASKAAEVNLSVDGRVANVVVESKAKVSVSGKTDNTVNITNDVEGTTINSSVKTDITLNAEAQISLDKGAEGSSVKLGNENVTPIVENKTDSNVTITDSKGQDSIVASGESGAGTPVRDTDTTKPDSGNTSDSGNQPSGGDQTSGGDSVEEEPYPDKENPDSIDQNPDSVDNSELEVAM